MNVKNIFIISGLVFFVGVSLLTSPAFATLPGQAPPSTCDLSNAQWLSVPTLPTQQGSPISSASNGDHVGLSITGSLRNGNPLGCNGYTVKFEIFEGYEVGIGTLVGNQPASLTFHSATGQLKTYWTATVPLTTSGSNDQFWFDVTGGDYIQDSSFGSGRVKPKSGILTVSANRSYACITDTGIYACDNDSNCANLQASTATHCKSGCIQIDKNLCDKPTKIYGCIAGDGVFACSPNNKSDCSDVVNNACAGRQCIQDNPQKCKTYIGAPGTVRYGCVDQQCVATSTGVFTESTCNNSCAASGSGTGTGTGTGTGSNGPVPGANTELTIPNPLGCENLKCVTDNIIKTLYKVAIPIVAIVVLWGAFQMMTAGGDPEKFKTGRKTILYAAIGFAVVLLASSVSGIIQSIFS